MRRGGLALPRRGGGWGANEAHGAGRFGAIEAHGGWRFGANKARAERNLRLV